MSTDDDLAERVAWLERAVAQLSAQSNPPIALPPRPGEGGSLLSPAVQELIRAGNTIQAVQQHRLDAGVGLAEAKAAVDSFSG
jgi:ribosomal protein L7/L12